MKSAQAKEIIAKQRKGYGSGYNTVSRATFNSRGCWLSRKKPSDRGYIKLKVDAQVSVAGRSKEVYLQQIAVVAKDDEKQKSLLLTDGYEASHLCHEKLCFNPNHIFMEPKAINISRNDCICVKIGEKHYSNCNHQPQCILKVTPDMKEYKVVTEKPPPKDEWFHGPATWKLLQHHKAKEALEKGTKRKREDDDDFEHSNSD